MKRIQIGDRVIGRHDDQNRVLSVRARGERGERQRRCGVAASGFNHDARMHANLPRLFVSSEIVLCAADDDRVRRDIPRAVEARHAPHRGLQ
jgi:hypothetical protein